jgi:plastocyanin
MNEHKSVPRCALAGLGRLAIAAGVLVAIGACTSSGSHPTGACAKADASNTVQLHADNLQFSAPCIEAAPGKPIVIVFSNDEGQPHDVVVYKDSSKAEELVRGDIITGPGKQTTVTVPTQPPGELHFECSVHPQMNGLLKIGGGGAAPSAAG